jgi:uncharacterized membrane protein YheB (UPF0754 family)
MADIYHIVRPFFQPAIGAFHGWFATRMVVVMLFRPHRAYYFFGTDKRIPFTPGIFPSRKKQLAQNISKTVTETLLTPEDIKSRTDNFVTEQNIFLVVSATVETMLDGLKYTDNIQKLAGSISHSIPDMINTATNAFIDRLINDQNKQLSRLSDYFVNDVFLNIKISEENAKNLVDYVFNSFLAPSSIRTSLHDALTPERAINLQMVLRDRTTGALKFILSLVNLEKIFNNFKEYLKNEPEKSEELIQEVIDQLKVKEDLISRISALDFKKLSFEDIARLKSSLTSGVRSYLTQHRSSINNSLSHLNENITDVINQQIVNFSPSHLKPETILMIKNEISRFFYNYLKTDLTSLINKGIQALKPKEMIESKIEAYSSQDVEDLILGIMRRELKNLEFLGLLIGLLLGCSALAIEYFLPIR